MPEKMRSFRSLPAVLPIADPHLSLVVRWLIVLVPERSGQFQTRTRRERDAVFGETARACNSPGFSDKSPGKGRMREA